MFVAKKILSNFTVQYIWSNLTQLFFLGEHAGFIVSFLLGYGVTVVSEIVAYPFDTVRRRMMMTVGKK